MTLLLDININLHIQEYYLKHKKLEKLKNKLEDLTVLKRSPELLNNVKKRSRSTTAYNETYFVLSSDLKQSNEYSIKQPSDF